MIKICNKYIFILSLLFSYSVYASNNCFIAKENGRVMKQVGSCDKRHSPFSTFKIPIALMAFDAGILRDADTPMIKFTKDIEKRYITYFNAKKFPIMLLWKRDQTPRSWMSNSVVWYSRYITSQLGMKKFLNYIAKFEYGNEEVTGEEHDALMSSWLDNSIKISPMEQVEFIEKLINRTLPVSAESMENTIETLKSESLFDDWQVYGKTGGAIKMGWFVGWVEKGTRRIAIAQYIEQPEESLISGGRIAKEVAKDNLITLLVQNH